VRKIDKGWQAWWWLGLLLLPVLLGLLWGDTLAEGAYAHLAAVQGVARAPLGAPLYVGVLALLGRLGLALPWAAVLLSALGWGVAAVALLRIGEKLGWRMGGVVSGILVACSPEVVRTLGQAGSWAVAWSWLAALATLEGWWAVQMGAWLALWCTEASWTTLGLGVVWLVVQGRLRRRVPVWGLAVWIAAVGAWLWAGTRGWVALLGVPEFAWASWRAAAGALLRESELYWLWVPCLVLGVVAVVRHKECCAGAGWVGLAWGVLALLDGGLSGVSQGLSLVWLLGGIGLAFGVQALATRGLVALAPRTLAVGAGVLAVAVLGGAQARSLWERYGFRPVAQQALEDQAGAWLRAHSDADAVVLGSARVGYAAERPVLAWEGTSTALADLGDLLQQVNAAPPDYCVTSENLSWWRLRQTGWFQDGYTQVAQFADPADPASPLTVWAYRVHKAALGERRPLDIRLPGEVAAIGYTYWPERIDPGDPVYMTLFLEATQPVTRSFKTVLQVLSLDGETLWAQQDALTPRSIPLDWWQPGQVLSERFVLTTTTALAPGAHPLDMFVVTSASGALPMYKGDDPTPLERVTLGYVVVPWEETPDMSGAVEIQAGLGDQITLLGFEAVAEAKPGDALPVTLYWQAQGALPEDYTVFVHLLDSDGALVASHDGPPMAGRYPTRAWAPGEVVKDTHPLALPTDLAPGRYRLQVGMYRWPSLERLPAADDQGVLYPEGAVVLQSVDVR